MKDDPYVHLSSHLYNVTFCAPVPCTWYNVFNGIYTSLRNMFIDLGRRWQQTGLTLGAEDTVADLGMEIVRHYYNEHSGYKDLFILGNIFWYRPHIAASFEEENFSNR